MTYTPDKDTSWSALFSGGFAAPGIKIELKSLIGKKEYNAGVYSYDSNIGVDRGLEINPLSLLGMLGPVKSKALTGIGQFFGNYEIQVSEYMNIVLGNQLVLERSSVSFDTNREYSKAIKGSVIAILVSMALADIAVVMSISYGLKENDLGAKILVGAQHIVFSVLLVVFHILESYGTEAPAIVFGLVQTLTNRIDNLKILISNNAHVPDILNPLLTQARATNLITISKAVITNTNKAIANAEKILNTLSQNIPQNPGCWVARAVYGPENPRWVQFREWLFGSGPVPEMRTPLQRAYMLHGEKVARFVGKSTALRWSLRLVMDLVLFIHRKKTSE
jgi:hypothetical protein